MEPKKGKFTLYMTESQSNLLNSIYCKRIWKRKKSTKSDIINEAIMLLANQEGFFLEEGCVVPKYCNGVK